MKKHIMIVDDEKFNIAVVMKMLECDFEVSYADSGERALKLLEKSIPDLMLLDINMPNMSGLDVMDRMQEHPLWRNIPIIFLTGDSDSACEVKCLMNGALDYIHKPFDAEIMLARIYRIIKITEDRRELERQWQNIHNMVSVEQVLFDAHRTDNGIENAMQLICETEGAERAFIIEEKQEGFVCVAEWCTECSASCFDIGRKIDSRAFEPWMYKLKKKLPINIQSIENVKNNTATYESLVARNVKNFVAVPIYFSDNTFFGFLGVDNPGINLHSIDMLCFMSLGFSMALENLEEHNKMEKLGKYDFDTGALNRNSYFNFIHDFEEKEDSGIGCIFVDVNGLHEYNNKYGHKKGDKMLETIAKILLDEYGKDAVFRIGGDEFVVIVSTDSREYIEKTMTEVDRAVKNESYSISYGIVFRNKNIDISDMVKEADALMYEAKERYYSKSENYIRACR